MDTHPIIEDSARARVEACIAEAIASFGPDPAHITPAATLVELDLDSLDLAELTQIIEDQFGVVLTSEDAAALKTVSDTVELVLARRS